MNESIEVMVYWPNRLANINVEKNAVYKQTRNLNLKSSHYPMISE